MYKLKVKLENGLEEEFLFGCGHKLNVIQGLLDYGEWMLIENIKVGDILETESNPVFVTGIEFIDS